MKQNAYPHLLALLAFGSLLAGLSQPARAEDAPANDKPKWITSAAAGLTLTRGNSETLLFTGDLKTARKWEHDELRLGADVAYGEDRDVKNNELIRGTAQWDHLFTERLYSFLRFEALHDGIADVDVRLTLSGGPGYYFIKNDKLFLAGEVGPGYVFERLGGEDRSYATLRMAERFQYKLNDRVRLFETAEYLPQIDDWHNYIVNLEAGIEADLTRKTALRVSLLDTFHNEPAPGRKKNDLKLVTSIVWKF